MAESNDSIQISALFAGCQPTGALDAQALRTACYVFFNSHLNNTLLASSIQLTESTPQGSGQYVRGVSGSITGLQGTQVAQLVQLSTQLQTAILPLARASAAQCESVIQLGLTPFTTGTASYRTSDELPAPTIAGIVISAVLGTALIAAAIAFVWNRRNTDEKKGRRLSESSVLLRLRF